MSACCVGSPADFVHLPSHATQLHSMLWQVWRVLYNSLRGVETDPDNHWGRFFGGTDIRSLQALGCASKDFHELVKTNVGKFGEG